MTGQVKTLLIAEGYSHEGYVYPDSGVLTLEKKKDVATEEMPVRVADVVDLVTEEAFRQQSEVIIVRNELADNAFNGVGVILRFKM